MITQVERIFGYEYKQEWFFRVRKGECDDDSFNRRYPSLEEAARDLINYNIKGPYPTREDAAWELINFIKGKIGLVSENHSENNRGNGMEEIEIEAPHWMHA